MVQASRLTYEYRSGRGIRAVSIEIPRCAIAALVGPNGSGKSTFLRCIAGVIRPQSGKVFLSGQDSTSLRRSERARRVAFLTQLHVVPQLVRVRELVARGRRPYHRAGWTLSARDHECIEAAMECVGIQNLAHRSLDRLSGGERQRAWIAMALAQDTDILLLDEPLAHLDLRYQWGLIEVLSRIRDTQGKTILIVMHELAAAAALADQVVAFKDGHVAAAGTPAAVFNEDILHIVFGVRVDIHRRKTCPRRPCLTLYV